MGGKRIDVWWRDDATGHLSHLLAHLMTRADGWEDALLRVRVICTSPAELSTAEASVRLMLEDVRIEAEVDAVDVNGPDDILKASEGACATFLPLRIRGGRLSGPTGRPLASILGSMPVTALVVAGKDIDLEAEHDDVEHEENDSLPSREATADAPPTA